jgi:hypothetical protein
VNTGAPLPYTGSGYFTETLAARAGDRSSCSWRAGCGETRKSGSGGGGEETTGTGPSPPTLRGRPTFELLVSQGPRVSGGSGLRLIGCNAWRLLV